MYIPARRGCVLVEYMDTLGTVVIRRYTTETFVSSLE